MIFFVCMDLKKTQLIQCITSFYSNKHAYTVDCLPGGVRPLIKKIFNSRNYAGQFQWRIQGACAPSPQWDQILSFLHTFPPKSARVGGRCSPPPTTGNRGSAAGQAHVNKPVCLPDLCKSTVADMHTQI